jgi:hypothetical protein
VRIQESLSCQPFAQQGQRMAAQREAQWRRVVENDLFALGCLGQIESRFVHWRAAQQRGRAVARGGVPNLLAAVA